MHSHLTIVLTNSLHVYMFFEGRKCAKLTIVTIITCERKKSRIFTKRKTVEKHSHKNIFDTTKKKKTNKHETDFFICSYHSY